MTRGDVPLSQLKRDMYNALNELYISNGKPSARDITVRAGVGVISHNTVRKVLTDPSSHKLAHLIAVVKALGGDEKAFHARWVEVTLAGSIPPPPPPPPEIKSENGSELVKVTENDSTGTDIPDPEQPPTSHEHPRFDQPYPEDGHRPLGDELFLLMNDHRGCPILRARSIDIVLAAAVLGELIIAGDIVLDAAGIVHARPATTGHAADSVAGYVARTVAAQHPPLPLSDWIRYLTTTARDRVSQRLAAAKLITRERHRLHRHKIWYPRTPAGRETNPDIRINQHLLDEVLPPDLHTGILVGLIFTVGLRSSLALINDGAGSQIWMTTVLAGLPPSARNLITIVDHTLAREATTQTR